MEQKEVKLQIKEPVKHRIYNIVNLQKCNCINTMVMNYCLLCKNNMKSCICAYPHINKYCRRCYFKEDINKRD